MPDVRMPDGVVVRFPDDMPRDQIKAMIERKFPAAQTAQPESRGIFTRVDDAVRGAADALSFGFADEIAAGLGSLTGLGGEAGAYDANLAAQRKRDAEGGWERTAGQVAGSVAAGAGLARKGLSLAANAAGRGAGLGRVAAGGAADGAIMGALQGAGSGEDAASRTGSAAVGSLAGMVLGAGAPYAVAGASKVAQPFVAPIMARLKPDKYAQKALIEAMRRSGKTDKEITAALRKAIADGQDQFTVADAMGNAGQRMLSTAARNPHEGRQALVDTLVQRQMGQGERLSNALAEGFNAPDTALQRAATLKGQRSQLADVNYGAARNGAGAVDVSGAIREIDDVLQPGVNAIVRPQSGIADDSIEGVVRRAQSLLTDGKSVNSNFDSVLRAKQDIADWISAAQQQGKSGQVKFLSQINQQLDAALERASPAYRTANDTFKGQSRTIDAVDLGSQAASGRTRASDNIASFQRMPKGEKSAFRAGYVDPLIAKVESSAMAPMTNKARPLITEKTGQEFPAFAEPRRVDKMGRRIAREQRMFETANAALGGSKTADNIADAADMAQFDPTVLSNLLRGNFTGAAMSAISRTLNEAKGLPASVLTQLSKALMETNPNVAMQLLATGTKSVNAGARQRAILGQMLTNVGASGAARFAAP